MKAIAWDDQPEDYLDHLISRLHDQSETDAGPAGSEQVIEVEHHSTLESFRHAFLAAPRAWAFVLTDLVEVNHPAQGEREEVGRQVIELVRKHNSQVPIFVVTAYFNVLRRDAFGKFPNVIIKSKSTRQSWMANEILEELRRMGIRGNPKSCVLVPGFTTSEKIETLRQTLTEAGINVLSPEEDMDALQQCGSFLIPASGQAVNVENGLLNLGAILRLPRGGERVHVVDLDPPSDKQPAVLRRLRDSQSAAGILPPPPLLSLLPKP